MLVLGIETSCDETAAAVLKGPSEVRSNVVSSQVEVHRPYGGVVPEIASRKHMEWIVPIIGQALREADAGIEDVQGIAVTQGPGLIGSLLIGVGVAKALAYARKIPLVGVHHLAAHIAAIYLEDPEIAPPFVALVVSGGHTALYYVPREGHFRSLGETRDDAAGEAFDKVAKLLELGYPGGPVIDRLAAGGDPAAVDFPRALMGEETLDFSFSGLKTAVLFHLRERCLPPLTDRPLSDLTASFQEALVDVLVGKAGRAAAICGVDKVVVTGGVACNSRLRDRMKALGVQEGIDVRFPSPALCTDNAVMVARAGLFGLEQGRPSPDLQMNARSRWELSDYSM